MRPVGRLALRQRSARPGSGRQSAGPTPYLTARFTPQQAAKAFATQKSNHFAGKADESNNCPRIPCRFRKKQPFGTCRLALRQRSARPGSGRLALRQRSTVGGSHPLTDGQVHSTARSSYFGRANVDGNRWVRQPKVLCGEVTDLFWEGGIAGARDAWRVWGGAGVWVDGGRGVVREGWADAWACGGGGPSMVVSCWLSSPSVVSQRSVRVFRKSDLRGLTPRDVVVLRAGA